MKTFIINNGEIDKEKIDGIKKNINDLTKISFKKVNLNNFEYVNYKYRKLGEYEQATNNLIKVLKKIEKDKKIILR